MFNIFFLLFEWAHQLMSPLLHEALLAGLFGILCGIMTMALYAVVSPQKAIADQKEEIKELRSRIIGGDCSSDEELKLLWKNLALSFKLLGMSLTPTLVSALPIIPVILWFALYHSYTVEASQTVKISWSPAEQVLNIESDSKAAATGTSPLMVQFPNKELKIIDSSGVTAFQGQIRRPLLPMLLKKQWWSALVASDVGYINEQSTVDSISFDLRRKLLIEGAPWWVSIWEFVFFVPLCLAAVLIKVIYKIE